MDLFKQAQRFYEAVLSSGANGLDFQHAHLCDRRCWLHLHRCDFVDSEHIRVGSQLHENAYRRDRSLIGLTGLSPDKVDWTNRIIHEIKKSGSHAEAAAMQLSFYLAVFLAVTEVEWTGSLAVGSLKDKTPIRVDARRMTTLNSLHDRIIHLKRTTTLPDASRIQLCSGCSNSDFCWGDVH